MEMMGHFEEDNSNKDNSDTEDEEYVSCHTDTDDTDEEDPPPLEESYASMTAKTPEKKMENHQPASHETPKQSLYDKLKDFERNQRKKKQEAEKKTADTPPRKKKEDHQPASTKTSKVPEENSFTYALGDYLNQIRGADQKIRPEISDKTLKLNLKDDERKKTVKTIKELLPETADTSMEGNETDNGMDQQDRIRTMIENLDQIRTMVEKTPEVKTGEDKTCGRIPKEDKTKERGVLQDIDVNNQRKTE